MRKRDLERRAIRELKRWVRNWRRNYITAPDASSGFGDEIPLFRAGERLLVHDKRGRRR